MRGVHAWKALAYLKAKAGFEGKQAFAVLASTHISDTTITLVPSIEGFTSAVSLFAELAPDLFLEFFDEPFGLGKTFCKFARVDVDGFSASSTNDLRVRLEPSDFLLGFVATLRARNINAGVRVEVVGHQPGS